MRIKDLRDGMRNISVEGEIGQLDEPRQVYSKDNTKHRVSNATLTDESGTVDLVLWDNQIDMVTRGASAKITNGYCNSFKGMTQLNVGKYGRLELV